MTYETKKINPYDADNVIFYAQYVNTVGVYALGPYVARISPYLVLYVVVCSIVLVCEISDWFTEDN